MPDNKRRDKQKKEHLWMDRYLD